MVRSCDTLAPGLFSSTGHRTTGIFHLTSAPETIPRLETDQCVVSVATRAQLENHPAWQHAFANQRKDARYYQIVEDTISQGFEYRYFVIENSRTHQAAIQPFFVLRQDFVAGAGAKIQSVIRFIRKLLPRFLTMRTIMIGCAAGEGHLDARDDDAAWITTALQLFLRQYSREIRAPLLVWKEFPMCYRPALRPLIAARFTRVPSLPMTRLGIDFPDFDAYMTKVLSKSARRDLRRKFKAAADAEPIAMQVTSDIAPYIDEVYPLYLQVFEKSSLQFEKLTKEYFCRIGREMPDKAKFFIWRQGGRAVAFNFCMQNRDELWDEYLGLDYSVALDLHLYFITLRDVMDWAMRNRFKWYCSGGQGFEPKLHLRCQLVPVDLYVKHTSPLVNFILKRVLPLVEPTRGDKTLAKFPNYADVWGKPEDR